VPSTSAEIADDPLIALPALPAWCGTTGWAAESAECGGPDRGGVREPDDTFEAFNAGLGIAYHRAGHGERYRDPKVAAIPIRGLDRLGWLLSPPPGGGGERENAERTWGGVPRPGHLISLRSLLSLRRLVPGSQDEGGPWRRRGQEALAIAVPFWVVRMPSPPSSRDLEVEPQSGRRRSRACRSRHLWPEDRRGQQQRAMSRSRRRRQLEALLGVLYWNGRVGLWKAIPWIP